VGIATLQRSSEIFWHIGDASVKSGLSVLSRYWLQEKESKTTEKTDPSKRSATVCRHEEAGVKMYRTHLNNIRFECIQSYSNIALPRYSIQEQERPTNIFFDHSGLAGGDEDSC
jgi:hypothetical protein